MTFRQTNEVKNEVKKFKLLLNMVQSGHIQTGRYSVFPISGG